MKYFLISFLLLFASLTSTAQTAPVTQAPATKVYICDSPTSYAYHTSDKCQGLERCSHQIKAITQAKAEAGKRRPCQKCH